MRHQDGTYELYSKTVNKQDKEKDDAKIDREFKIAMKGLIRECIKFTRLVQIEKNNPDINFKDCLRF